MGRVNSEGCFEEKDHLRVDVNINLNAWGIRRSLQVRRRVAGLRFFPALRLPFHFGPPDSSCQLLTFPNPCKAWPADLSETIPSLASRLMEGASKRTHLAASSSARCRSALLLAPRPFGAPKSIASPGRHSSHLDQGLGMRRQLGTHWQGFGLASGSQRGRCAN